MEENIPQDDSVHAAVTVSGLYENWFLDYASYVILERAVPAVEDGLKPVQRRILHAMKEMDDGRFHKVANIIGQTMQYHPHGDAAIGDALVNLGQKDLLIDCQGNWGDYRTGDSAAAPRYIEARLSKFALEVLFNPKTTKWQLSYDGRKKEPITLPVKFPLLLAQGVEGIAVGLSTKILPHNFIELIQASIAYLKNKPFELYPDFLTGGYVDVSQYQDGQKGGKVRVRAKIEEVDKKTLAIRDIPFGTTTQGLIDSVLKASDSGKIKIKKIIDNTAADVEIQVQLAPGISPDVTIDALYAFTDCEMSISPSACVIVDNKPRFCSVSDILKINTNQSRDLLKQELEIKLNELQEDWHMSSLEKIFIENRIYRDIEECETWESVIETIDQGLNPFKPLLRRTVTREDILKLTEIKIKRISKYDAFKADEYLRGLETEIEETKHHLAHINDFTIRYYENLLKKYGKGRERKTEIRVFDVIKANQVAVANQKLYINRAEGFAGFGLKKDEYVCDCSDLDDIIVFRKDGKFLVTKISEKAFVGKDILHAGVFRKSDDRMAYNMMYVDGKSAFTYAKRFQVTGITRDKEYDLTKGEKNSRVVHFSANPNSESEIVTVYLNQLANARKKVFDYDFAELAIKGRSSQGNKVTQYSVKRVLLKSKGKSTIGKRELFLDESVGRLNHDSRGRSLGLFDSDDRLLVVYKDGQYELVNTDLTQRFPQEQISTIVQFKSDLVITTVHYIPSQKFFYLKRFKIETSTEGKKFSFVSDEKGAQMLLATTADESSIQVVLGNKKSSQSKTFVLHELTDVKGWKAQGTRLMPNEVLSWEWLYQNFNHQHSDANENLVEDDGGHGTISDDDLLVEPGQTIELTLPERGTAEDPGEQMSLFD